MCGKAPISAAITRDRLSRLHLVAPGQSATPVVTLTKSMSFLTAIEALARSYDFIVVDAGAVPEEMFARVAEIAPRAMMIAPQGTAPGITEALKKLAAAGFREPAAATGVSAEKPLAA